MKNTTSVRKKGLYEGQDLVDEFLLDKFVKYVNYDKLSDVKKLLKVKDQELEQITSPDV